MSHSCTACCGHVGPGKHCYKCGLQGPPVELQQTHHPTCYREHHVCAVARLDRLRAYLERGDVVRAFALACTPDSGLGLLVAVRDITEGRS